MGVVFEIIKQLKPVAKACECICIEGVTQLLFGFYQLRHILSKGQVLVYIPFAV